MSGTCKDCKWWQPFDQSYSDPDMNAPSYYEEKNRHYIGYGECGLSVSSSGVPETKGSPLVAVDYEDYSAALYTSPDFGCNQFAPRT